MNHSPFIPAWLDDAGLSAAEFRIYCHLARRADNTTGLAWPSYESMEEATGFSRMTVARALKSLVEERKLIEKAGKPFGGSARYRLLSPIVSPEVPLASNSITSDTIEPPPIVSPANCNSASNDTPIVSPEAREGSPSKGIQRRVSNREISSEGKRFATWFRSTLPETMNLGGNWQEKFGQSFDDLVRIDNRDPDEIQKISAWARSDSFWSGNFHSPAKLRKRNKDGAQYFDVFAEKMHGSGHRPNGSNGGQHSSNPPSVRDAFAEIITIEQ